MYKFKFLGQFCCDNVYISIIMQNMGNITSKRDYGLSVKDVYNSQKFLTMPVFLAKLLDRHEIFFYITHYENSL